MKKRLYIILFVSLICSLSLFFTVKNKQIVNEYLGADKTNRTILDINSLIGYPLSIAHGGTNNTSYTSGSVLYFDGSKIAQDNSNFFYGATNKQFAIGTNTFDSNYQKLNVVGNEATGQGVVSTLRNTDNTSYSFSSYEMYAGTSGNYGGKFFGSRSAFTNFGIVNGLTFRAGRSDQDIGFAVGNAINGTANGPTLFIKSTGQVVIGNYQVSSFLSGTYQFEIYSGTGSANLFVNSTGAFNSNLRIRGQNSSTVYMDIFSGKDVGQDAYGFYGYGSAYAVFGTNGTGRLYIESDGNVGIGGHPGSLALSLVKTQNATSVFQITNSSSGSSASMQMKMVNNSGNGSGMYMTSSGNSAGGGTNSLNIFNDAGSIFLFPASGGSVSLNSDLKLTAVGKGIYIKEGTNATMGHATLSSGTVTVSTTKVTANSRIFLTINGGTQTNVGSVRVSSVSSGTSFTITSDNALDASGVDWIIIEPL